MANGVWTATDGGWRATTAVRQYGQNGGTASFNSTKSCWNVRFDKIHTPFRKIHPKLQLVVFRTLSSGNPLQYLRQIYTDL